MVWQKINCPTLAKHISKILARWSRYNPSVALWPAWHAVEPSSSDDKFWRVQINIYYHIMGKSTDCNGWGLMQTLCSRKVHLLFAVWLDQSRETLGGKRSEHMLCPLDATTCGAGSLLHYLLRTRQGELPPAKGSDPSRTRPQARTPCTLGAADSTQRYVMKIIMM